MERQRLLMWEEHEAHYQWIEQEKVLIRGARRRLCSEEAQLQELQRRLQDLLDRGNDMDDALLDELQERVAAFESVVNKYNLRVNRWREECDRYHAIDRIIARPDSVGG